MKHKVIFYLPMSLMSPALEINLDLMQIYLDKGYDVTWVYCNGEFPTCDINPSHKWSSCHACKNRRKAGFKWLDGRVKLQNFYRLTDNQLNEVNQIERMNFASIDEVRKFTLNGADVGMAALSTLISRFREPHPDIDAYMVFFKAELKSAVIAYFSVCNLLLEAKPDEFILFNGRTSLQRPALRAAQQLGVNCQVVEGCENWSKYKLIKGTYPHDIQYAKREVDINYSQSTLPFEEKLKIAKDYFDSRENGVAENFICRTGNQKKGLLPDNLSADCTNLVIFNSSEDEFVCIEEWNNPHYLSQNDGIARLMESLRETKDIRVFLRVHPNLSGLDNSQTRGIKAIQEKHPDLNVISAESKISTYALLKSCDVVLTFGSTVGIEAVYHGKPSILMGRALYEDLGCCIKPASHAELIDILHLISKGQYLLQQENHDISIAKYGFYIREYGNSAVYRRPYNYIRHSLVKKGKEIFLEQPVMTKLLFRFYPKLKMTLKKFEKN